MISEFSAGKIFNDSFKLYSKHFPVLFAITVTCCLPYFAADVYLKTSGEAETNAARSTLVLALISMICTPLATGALTFSVYQSLRSKPVTIGESLTAGFARFLPLLGVAVCAGLFITAGMVLLLIPGIMLATLLYVASPVCVVEKKGVFASMQRSRTLTSGRKWQIFVVMFGIGLVLWIFLFAFMIAIPRTNKSLNLGVELVWQTIFTGWNATAAALSYYHLRSIHESVDIEDIANVFD